MSPSEERPMHEMAYSRASSYSYKPSNTAIYCLNMRRGEFLAFMLIAMQKAKQEDVDQLRAIFDKLDKDNNQFLDKKDLQTLVRYMTLRGTCIICCNRAFNNFWYSLRQEGRQANGLGPRLEKRWTRRRAPNEKREQ